MQPMVQPFFDPVTGTVTYLVFQSGHQECAIIGPVLDYDPKSGRTATTNADRVIEFVRQSGVHAKWILETHAHADHLSAAHYLRGELGGAIAIGEHIRASQGVFKKLFNAEPEWETTMLAQLCITSMCTTASPKNNFSACARRAMQHWRCPSLSCLPCK